MEGVIYLIRRLTAFFLAFIIFFSLSAFVSASGGQAAAPEDSSEPPSTSIAQGLEYLDQNPPGQNSILVSSLAHTQAQPQAQERLEQNASALSAAEYQDALALARLILDLVKLDKDPTIFGGRDLPAILSSHENLYAQGIDGGSFALIAYRAANYLVFESAKNAVPVITDYLLSSQLRSGGFAATPGKDPDVRTTAHVVTALAPQKEDAYVDNALQKALSWLSTQQAEDGSFSWQGAPHCESTAAVLIALETYGLSLSDSRFAKPEGDLLQAVERFQNADGGYSSALGDGISTVDATENALLALYAAHYDASPYLSPDSYPGYTPPQQEQTDARLVYQKFLIGFPAILAIIYAILLLTNWIGKKFGDRKLPTIRNPYVLDEDETMPSEPSRQADEEKTMELQIPMKAEIPNFDDISEEDSYPRK